MKTAATLLPVVLVAGCVTSQPLMASDFTEERESVKVVLMEPDVEMLFMTTSNVPELRADWTEAAETNLVTSIKSNLEKSGEIVIDFDPSKEDVERVRQITLLNQVVTNAITSHVGLMGSNTIPIPLPHKGEDVFDYTLGEGVVALAENYDADYALFLTSKAQFESSGVFLRNVLIGAATGYVPASTAFRGTFASLVDLETGQIVWMDGQVLGDPRNADEAETLTARVLSTIPLAD